MRGASTNVISLVGMIAGLGVGAAVAATASVPGPILNRLCFAAAAVLIQLRLLANMLDGMGADACYYRRTMDRRSATMADCPAPPGTVLITFACIGDLHTCPMSDGPKPHVGGPVAMGCGNVFIAGMPAARVSDTTTCAVPPDGLAMGSQTPAGLPGR